MNADHEGLPGARVMRLWFLLLAEFPDECSEPAPAKHKNPCTPIEIFGIDVKRALC